VVHQKQKKIILAAWLVFKDTVKIGKLYLAYITRLTRVATSKQHSNINDKTTVIKGLGELDFVEVILPSRQNFLKKMAKTTHHLSPVFLVPYTDS